MNPVHTEHAVRAQHLKRTVRHQVSSSHRVQLTPKHQQLVHAALHVTRQCTGLAVRHRDHSRRDAIAFSGSSGGQQELLTHKAQRSVCSGPAVLKRLLRNDINHVMQAPQVVVKVGHKLGLCREDHNGKPRKPCV